MIFAEFLRSLGLQPRDIRDDGRVRRCPTDDHPRSRNGAYWLAPGGFAGWAQNHATMGDIARWRAEGHVDVPEFDPKKLREAKRRQRHELIAATRAARTFYEAATPLRGGHPYLAAHGLDMTGCFGIRVDLDGWLVVPAWRGESLTTVQRISPEGEKRFWTGASVKGSSYAIERRSAALTILCEGLATGLAVYAAVPLSRVVICFTTGNMAATAQRMPSGLTVIAADNDHRTICQRHRTEGLSAPYEPWEQRPEWCTCNPGRCAAVDAASAIRCGVALPTEIDGTDWADWRQERLVARLEAWGRRGHVTEAMICRDVDAEVAREMQRNALFRAPEVA